MFAKLLQRDKGFTLLELLIVSVIIGILAVIIVPGLASGPQRARDAQRKADVRGLKNALETYYNDQSSAAYPNVAGASAGARYLALCTSTFPTCTTGPLSGYITTLPQDAKNSSPFVYQYAQKDATSTSSQVIACLENSKESQTANTSTVGYNTQQTIAACSGTANQTYAVQTIN